MTLHILYNKSADLATAFETPLTGTSTDTGQKFPSANDGTVWLNPGNVYASDNTRSIGTAAQAQKWSTFNFGLPSGVTITGITVTGEGFGGGFSCVGTADLSWNGGTSWTSTKNATFTATTDNTQTWGGSTDTWGRTWTDTEFSNTNFRLRVTNGGATTLEIDALQVRVYYTVPVTVTDDYRNLIAGPRSTFFSMPASTTDQGMGYAHQGTNNTPTHIVVARADKLLTSTGMRLRGAQRASGGTWTVLGPDLAPITSSDLTGIRGQDYVVAVSPSSLQGVGIIVNPHPSGTASGQISKLFGATSFTFGNEPTAGATFDSLPIGTYSQPLRCIEPYEVEQRFSLVWPLIDASYVTSFLALPQIFRWPIFLYDDTQSIFQWKLEHVIIEGYKVLVHEKDRVSIEVTFARLRHYE